MASPSSTAARSGARRACVRCGYVPPARERFLCDDCLADPTAEFEQRIAEESVIGYRDQRRMLVDLFGWYGGWWPS